MKELSDCCGRSICNEDEDIEREGVLIREKYHLKYLFVTRSEKGITSIGSKEIIHCPAMARDVFDVSGAGDTVMAVLAAALAAGRDSETALKLANTAAGIAVSRVGTYPVRREEVLDAWENEERDLRKTTFRSPGKRQKGKWRGGRKRVKPLFLPMAVLTFCIGAM